MDKNLLVEEKEYVNTICGSWHGKRVYTYDGGYLTVTGVITGCGLAQMHGIKSLSKENLESFKTILEKIKSDYRKDGAGAILCTLGMSYYNQEPFLLDAGFELLSEYTNYRHGEEYTQRLYILKY